MTYTAVTGDEAVLARLRSVGDQLKAEGKHLLQKGSRPEKWSLVVADHVNHAHLKSVLENAGYRINGHVLG